MRARGLRLCLLLSALSLCAACSTDEAVETCASGDCSHAEDSGSNSATRMDVPAELGGFTADVPPVDRAALQTPTSVASIALTPANPTVEVVGAQRAPVNFRVTATQRNGLTRVLTMALRFTLEPASLGVIDDATGVFTPSGIGGVGQVRVATTDGSALAAQTMVTVHTRDVVLGPGVTEADRMMLDRASSPGPAAQVPTVDYPLEGAVMPRNVYAPEFHWTPRHTGAGATDLWSVRLTRPHASLTAYVVAAAGFRHLWTPTPEQWATFAQSDVGQPIEMTVSALSRGLLHQSAPRRFRTVDGVTAGSVYYWSPSRSRLTRIDVEQARRVEFLPSPGASCIGCHAVSRDGQRLSGFLEGGVEDVVVYDLSRDLTGTPAPNVLRRRYPSRRCSSFNPGATRMVLGDCGANPSSIRMSLVDAASGTDLPVAAMGPDGFDPEWSPDGQSVAFTDRRDQLSVVAMPAGGSSFGATRVLHDPTTLTGGRIDWHPTWSPDSRWIAFQHGETRRTGVNGRGDLWMLPGGGGPAVRLDRANGGASTGDTFRPVFSPFDSGGYFWLLFTSSRPYGNTLAGARNVKLIWVTAVRNRPDGRADPSEVAYLLPGQERATSLSPYWTPAPCRPNGNTCSTGADCCSGTCDPDTTGNRTCVPARNQCRARGQSCSSNADCCMGLVCTEGRICDLPPPA